MKKKIVFETTEKEDVTMDVHIGYVGRSNNIIEADFIISMMSWSFQLVILLSHLFSCKITACKATSH